jgi:hypothetical protein
VVIERLTHALSSNEICQPTKEKLTNQSAAGCGHLHAEILTRAQGLKARRTCPIGTEAECVIDA